jgi:hypothetical protein
VLVAELMIFVIVIDLEKRHLETWIVNATVESEQHYGWKHLELSLAKQRLCKDKFVTNG